MNARQRSGDSRKWWISVTALLVQVSLGIVESFQGTPADVKTAAVTYSNGTLHTAIPYQAAHAGAGQLTVEVLDPEDGVLGRVERRVTASGAAGVWRDEIKLAKPLAVEDLVWHRLRYRFVLSGGQEAAIEGTESISELLRRPVVRVLGQQSYLAGGSAAVRVIVTDSKNETIAGGGSLRIEMSDSKAAPRVLFSGQLNRHGTAEAQFRFPAGVVGTYPLRYVVDTSLGQAEFTAPVRLEDKVSILLTTEKPLYQPGQTIHARALALDRANHQAARSRKLTFEVEDSRGNKVFKKATETDEYGIASAEFGLADEVNLGAYHLRALMDATNTSELALNVERYVLPKFKVAVEFAGDGNEARHGYRPGDHVKGTVRANYFFGKAVDGGDVTVKAAGMDVALFEAASAQGKTDGEGAYKFDLALPTYFAGRPLSQGAARVLVEATVKDSAGHSEGRGEPVTVSESPLIVTAVPEGGTLIPGLENQVFILTSYADGKPAVTEVRVHAPGNADQTAATDAGGVAVVRLKIAAGGAVRVEASDKQGNRVSATPTLETRTGEDQILLRTQRAVYKSGERISLRVFSTKERGTAYVDVVREGQTVVTRDLDIVGGQAELELTASPDMAGTLDINAYQFGRDARPVGDHRLVFVQPADDLKIEATADAAVYKPGGDARVNFRVTNSRGEGVQAALGVQVVDEAVFALAEKQPGFAKVFFYLEQEAMKPRFEIHSIGMPEAVEAVATGQVEQRDRAARALFSATEMVSTNKFETEFGRAVPTAKQWEYLQRYRTRFQGQAREAVARVVAGGSPGRDAWGGAILVQHQPNSTYYSVRSAGPDGRLATGDDLYSYVEVQTRKIVGRPTAGESAIEAAIEHERGPYNGRAEIAGTVVDQNGGAMEGATVNVRETATGKWRAVTARADGQFTLAALAAGEYEVHVAYGTAQLEKKIALAVRDRAVLSVYFRHEPAGAVVKGVETVEMLDMVPRRVQVGGLVRNGMLNGVPVEVAGGVMGGIVGGPKRMAVPPPPMAMPMPQLDAGRLMTEKDARMSVDQLKQEAPASGGSAPHVRSYFPEALYINPEILTDGHGNASISIPLADSITTWRMAMVGSTARGALGSGTSSLKVFQDFFVDLDLPVTLTQGDRVSIPVAAYNYSGARGDVGLQLEAADWYRLVDDVAAKSIAVEPGRVGGAQFTVEATRIGKFKLTLEARMGGAARRADIVVREIEVVPNGREQSQVFNGRLEGSASHTVRFPATAIADANAILVRLYPGPLSQVIEGMDSILQMPGGCFEQTSSSTYPNVLALDYMKRTKKLTPEVHAKAEGFIANGYQRLVTFEVPGGGFSWFGNAPANKILTAYGLMEFGDMAKVYEVDPRLIARTQQWLAGQQQADGSWKPDTQFINEGATNRYNSNVLRITAYLAWSLRNTGYQGPAVEKAREFVASHMSGPADPYTLAVVANFAADYAKDRGFTGQAMQRLLDARTEKGDDAWWNAEETSVYSTGASAATETTGLAVQALLKWGQASGVAGKALHYVASKKTASGAWSTTQATIMALRALLLATEKGGTDVEGRVEIAIDGRPMRQLVLTPENNDLLHQFVFKGADLGGRGESAVEVKFEGKGGLAYQVVGRYFVPWSERPAHESLSIDVTYDRTRLAQNDVATATATVRSNLDKPANMVMVDLGIPPGFDLLSEDLQAYQEKTARQKGGRLEKFSQTATQAILYFDSLAPGAQVTLSYRLRAKYPIRARTFASRAYEYYDPEVQSVARPMLLEVAKK
jgi:uncharacterized protein YfaS (alpha-2-macroglobulin family)